MTKGPRSSRLKKRKRSSRHGRAGSKALKYVEKNAVKRIAASTARRVARRANGAEEHWIYRELNPTAIIDAATARGSAPTRWQVTSSLLSTGADISNIIGREAYATFEFCFQFFGANSQDDWYNKVRFLIIKGKETDTPAPVIADWNALDQAASTNTWNLVNAPVAKASELSKVAVSDRPQYSLMAQGTVNLSPYHHENNANGDAFVPQNSKNGPNLKTVRKKIRTKYMQTGAAVVTNIWVLFWSDSTVSPHPVVEAYCRMSWDE